MMQKARGSRLGAIGKQTLAINKASRVKRSVLFVPYAVAALVVIAGYGYAALSDATDRLIAAFKRQMIYYVRYWLRTP